MYSDYAGLFGGGGGGVSRVPETILCLTDSRLRCRIYCMNRFKPKSLPPLMAIKLLYEQIFHRIKEITSYEVTKQVRDCAIIIRRGVQKEGGYGWGGVEGGVLGNTPREEGRNV